MADFFLLPTASAVGRADPQRMRVRFGSVVDAASKGKR
jgi:hypothetical protein